MLFAENAVLRIHAADLAPDRRFRFAIRDRHRIEAPFLAFVLDADLRTKPRQDLRAGRVGQMHCESNELRVVYGHGMSLERFAPSTD